jgi:hypothetical protein
MAVGVFLLMVRWVPWLGTAAGRCASALALAVGFVTGVALLQVAPLVPVASWQWLPSLAAGAAAAELLDVLLSLGWTLRAVVAVVCAALLVRSLDEQAPLNQEFLAGITATILLSWVVLDLLGRRLTEPRLAWVLCLQAMAAAVVVESAGFGKLAQMSGVLAAVFGGLALTWWRREAPGAIQGIVPGGAILLPALVWNGYFYNFTEMHWASFWLVLLTPLLLLVVSCLPFPVWARRWRPWLQALAVLVPLGLAVVSAVWVS